MCESKQPVSCSAINFFDLLKSVFQPQVIEWKKGPAPPSPPKIPVVVLYQIA